MRPQWVVETLVSRKLTSKTWSSTSLEVDELAGKHLTEIDFACAEADSAAAGDAHGAVVKRVLAVAGRLVAAR